MCDWPGRHDVTDARVQRPGGRVGGTCRLLLHYLHTDNGNLRVSAPSRSSEDKKEGRKTMCTVSPNTNSHSELSVSSWTSTDTCTLSYTRRGPTIEERSPSSMTHHTILFFYFFCCFFLNCQAFLKSGLIKKAMR